MIISYKVDSQYLTCFSSFLWRSGHRQIRAYITCGKPLRPATWSLPSSVRWIVTHLEGWAPFVVMAVINESNSSLFSLSFLTNDSMARLANPSLSPPCLWHINEWTIDRQASAEVGVDTTPEALDWEVLATFGPELGAICGVCKDIISWFWPTIRSLNWFDLSQH